MAPGRQLPHVIAEQRECAARDDGDIQLQDESGVGPSTISLREGQLNFEGVAADMADVTTV
jgi:hypothetical protein